MPIPGPGMPREGLALVHLRPQHIGPAAVAVGALSCLLASLVWWIAVPSLVVMGALLVLAGRRDWLDIDRTPHARALRRRSAAAVGERSVPTCHVTATRVPVGATGGWVMGPS